MPEAFSSGDGIENPPADDEIEVSIIGPGFGECVLVHAGSGRWLIVDSCRSGAEKDSAPLKYLHQIGVSPDNVAAIVVSHWDDDHCSGVAKLVTACSNARLIMSDAFVQKDFLAYVSIYSSPLTRNVRAGVKEIKEVMELLGNEKRPVTIAHAGRRLFTEADLGIPSYRPIEIWALSPCDFERENFLLWAASQMPTAGETRRVAVKRHRNDLSVVMHLRLGENVILLGGDLEEEGNSSTGWSALLGLAGRPRDKAHIFKVPHHGSQNGHHDDIPNELLADDPIAVVAPFKNGNVSLPRAADVKRICGFASQAFATATLQGRAPQRRDSMVEKTIREVTVRYSEVKSDPGMIRMRKPFSGGDWTVEKFGSATSLDKIF